MKPIKVGLVTTSYPLASDSTSGQFLYRLVTNLPDWVHTTIITPASTREAASTTTVGRIRVLAFRYAPRRMQRLAHQPGGVPEALKSRPWLFLLLPFFLLSMFVTCVRSGRHFDLFHANWSVNGVVAGLAGLLTRTPVITTLRGSDVNLCQKSLLYRLLLRLCFRLSQRVVVVSHSLRLTVTSLLSVPEPDRLIVIENGVDDAFLTIPRNESALNDDTLVRLVSIGNLTYNKGVEITIRALAQIADDNWVFHVVGDGPESVALRALTTSLQLSSRILFIGTVPASAVRDILENSDIFVHASRSEGRSNVILEAMAAALPVIATDIESSREFLQHAECGYLFPVDDVNELARYLQALTRDSGLRSRLGLAAREHIRRTQLRWTDTANRYACLYREVAAATTNSVRT